MKTIPDDPLESALRRDAQRVVTPVPDGMDWRISQAVSRSTRPASRARPLVVWTSAAALAALAVAVLFGVRLRNAGASTSDERVVAAELADAMKTMPARFWRNVQPGAETVLKSDPLQQEANALYSDARSAVGFLALNFLPESSPEPAEKSG